MTLSRIVIPLAALLTGGLAFQTPTPGPYAEPAACAPCNQQIWKAYSRRAMGRSFYRPGKDSVGKGTVPSGSYHHEASDEDYAIEERQGHYFQRRHHVEPDGRLSGVVEKEIHYVLGSGNHGRTFLHRTSRGQLIELPLGWYAEKGGTLGMNPGYDRPDHAGFRRKVDQECLFCHNAYPPAGSAEGSGRELFLGGNIPLGIDCQR